MNQVLHIFKKDTRRFWLEIVASFAALAIYVAHTRARWDVSIFAGGHGIRYSSMMYVVALAWWLLIARVIHAESLVGESEFWITRPYEWKNLLAAKLLFLGVWVYAPFVVAQMVVLAVEGFSAAGRASGWVGMLMFYSAAYIVPLVTIAAVTKNFARMALVVLIGYVAMTGSSAWVATHFYGRPVSLYGQGYGTMVPDTHDMVLVALVIVGGLAVVLLQYATRRVWVARGVGMATAVVVMCVWVGLSSMGDKEVEAQYPAGSGSAVRIGFAPSMTNPMWVGMNGDQARVGVPVVLDGVADGGAVEVDDVQFSMDAADGSHWIGPWRELQSVSSPFLPGMHHPNLLLMMDRKDYARWKGVPVTLHVALAVTELRAGRKTMARIASPLFGVAGLGVCSTEWKGEATSVLMCRSEFGRLPQTYVTADFSSAPCGGAQPVEGEVRRFADWTGDAYGDAMDAASEAVWLTVAGSGAYDGAGKLHGTEGLALCAGTAAEFTHYDVVRRSRVYLTVGNFQLPLEKKPSGE